MSVTEALERRYIEAMAARPAGAPWLQSLRQAARTEFASRGLPTRRVEAWKYSDLRRALEGELEANAQNPLPALGRLEGAALATFVDGVFRADRSDLAGLEAMPLTAALAEPPAFLAERLGRVNPQADHAVLSLNTALMEDGLVLRVPRGVSLDRPIHVHFLWREQSPPAAGHHLRLFLLLEANAAATLLETHEGAAGFATVVSEIALERDATLTHVRLERLGETARHAGILLGALGTASRYEGFFFAEGARFSRHEALIDLAGEGAEVAIDGAYLASDERHCDNTTVIRHAVPRTSSRQAFRGVLAGRARGVFQGRVSVMEDAQGTDARQLSKAVLLSHRAEVATKPELEILADDVKCSHGATAGELDATALFYLRSRGVPEAEARALLVEAFLEESVTAIRDERLRGLVKSAVKEWLGQHAGEVSHVG